SAVGRNRARLTRTATAVLATMAAVAALLAVGITPADAYNGARWFKPNAPYSDNFPDPAIVRDGNTFYAFGTSTGGSYLPVMTSTDLVTWIAHPQYPQPACVGGASDPFFNDALPCPAAWGLDRNVGGRLKKEVWAPGPMHIGNTWRVFYAIRVAADPDARFCIAMATSTGGPLGPYVDDSGGPF